MPYRRLPSLLALRAFESAARNGSMKKAAEELNVTPGAVSQLVKKLEEQMSANLLNRVNRGFELTEAGVRLLAGLTESFIRMREAVESVVEPSKNKSLLVACGPPFAAKWLVPRLGEFLDKHPDIDIRISSSFTKLDYRAENIDVGIRLSNDVSANLERTWVGEETMMVMASPNFIAKHNIKEPKDLLGLPLLLEDNSVNLLHTPSWADWMKAAALPMTNANSSINFGQYEEQALDAAISGAGVVLGRKVLASRDIVQGRLCCPFGPELNSGVHYQVVCRREIEHTEHAIAFKEWLTSELEKSMNICSANKVQIN